MTPNSSNDVNYLERQERFPRQSRSQTRYQKDPNNKELPQFQKICKYCRKKLINDVKSILKLDNNMMLNLNLPQRCQKIFSKITKINQINANVLQILMFHHINNITILPQNHLFGTRFLLTDKDPLLLVTKKDINKLSPIVLDLSHTNDRNIAFHNSHIRKNHSRSITPPQHNSTNIGRNSPGLSPLPMVNQVVDKLEDVFQVASLDNTMTDYHFLNYFNYFHVGIVQTTNMINHTQPNTSWYIPLNIPLKKPTQKTEPNFLRIEILLDTGATICISNSQTWNAIKTYLSPCKYELRKDVDTKLGTVNSQLLPTEGIVKLTLLPFRDNHAILTITFATAETKYIIFRTSFSPNLK